jgi:hypothetical protein
MLDYSSGGMGMGMGCQREFLEAASTYLRAQICYLLPEGLCHARHQGLVESAARGRTTVDLICDFVVLAFDGFDN